MNDPNSDSAPPYRVPGSRPGRVWMTALKIFSPMMDAARRCEILLAAALAGRESLDTLLRKVAPSAATQNGGGRF